MIWYLGGTYKCDICWAVRIMVRIQNLDYESQRAQSDSYEWIIIVEMYKDQV